MFSLQQNLSTDSASMAKTTAAISLFWCAVVASMYPQPESTILKELKHTPMTVFWCFVAAIIVTGALFLHQCTQCTDTKGIGVTDSIEHCHCSNIYPVYVAYLLVEVALTLWLKTKQQAKKKSQVQAAAGSEAEDLAIAVDQNVPKKRDCSCGWDKVTEFTVYFFLLAFHLVHWFLAILSLAAVVAEGAFDYAGLISADSDPLARFSNALILTSLLLFSIYRLRLAYTTLPEVHEIAAVAEVDAVDKDDVDVVAEAGDGGEVAAAEIALPRNKVKVVKAPLEKVGTLRVAANKIKTSVQWFKENLGAESPNFHWILFISEMVESGFQFLHVLAVSDLVPSSELFAIIGLLVLGISITSVFTLIPGLRKKAWATDVVILSDTVSDVCFLIYSLRTFEYQSK